MSFLLTFAGILVQALDLALLARFVLSWIDMGGQWRITQIVYEITEPILAPLRQLLPQVGVFDLSMLVAFVLLQVIARFLGVGLIL